MGALPRNHRRGLGRGRGSTSSVPVEAFTQAIQLAKGACQGRAQMFTDPLLVALRSADGSGPDDERIREAAALKIADFRQRIGSSDDRREQAADARHVVARSAARRMGAEMFTIGHLVRLLLFDDEIEPPRMPIQGRTALLQLLAGGADEASAEDLAEGLGALAGLQGDDHDALRAAVVAAEVSDDNWLAEIPDLAHLERVVRSEPPERLRRSLMVALDAPVAPLMLAVTAALYGGVARDRALEAIAHPLWQSWGQNLVPPSRPTHLIGSVVSAALLLLLPASLDAAERYTDLLRQLVVANSHEWSTFRRIDKSDAPSPTVA